MASTTTRKLLSALLLFTLSACASSTALPPGVSAPGDYETVVVLGLNDFHGSLVPVHNKLEEGGKTVDVEAGGAVWLAAQVKRLREVYGDHLLVIDAGDEWQGSLESNSTGGASVVDLFNRMGVQAAAVGNHEFDFGPADRPFGNLTDRFREADYPFLAANIVETATDKAPHWPNFRPSVLLQAGGIRVGVIGLATTFTPVTTRAEYVASLRFEDPLEPVKREAKRLREEGAQLVLITAHEGLSCHPENHRFALHDNRVWTPKSPQSECEPQEEIPRLLHALPKGTVDGVIAGHTHQITHHWLDGVPVVQSGAFGRYFSLMYLVLDKATGKPVPELSRIEGPIPTCPKVFANQGGCEVMAAAPKDGRGPLVAPTLRGAELHPDEGVGRALEKVMAAAEESRKRILGHAARALKHDREHESELMNLLADAIRAKACTDFALVNPGGVRVRLWDAGDISYELLYRTLPFENFISKITLTGAELETLMQVADSGSRGYFGTSGLIVEAMGLNHDAIPRDLNGDGKREPWEWDRHVRVRRWDTGKVLDRGKTYTLATLDFLVKGGDDLGWAMSRIPQDRVILNAAGGPRDAVVEFLAKATDLNGAAHPLVDPKRPRLILKSK